MSAPTTTHADAVILEVASVSAAAHDVEAVVVEVAWIDRAVPQRVEPQAFLLLQDKGLHGEAAITEATSQTGPHVATMYADDDNEGDLLPFASGDWDTDPSTPDPVPDDLLLRIVTTGSLYDSAEWAYKLNKYVSDGWVGMDDLRWPHRPENPFDTGTLTYGASMAMCYMTTRARVVICYDRGGGEFRFRHRQQHSTTWKEVVINVARDRRPQSATRRDMSLIELPDGSLRWIYLYEPPTAASNFLDADIWGSDDGGDTWELLKERVVTDILGEPEEVRTVTMVQSGDWIRLELWHHPSSGSVGLVSACSSDRCATWQVAVSEADGTDAKTTDLFKPYVYAVAAVDNQGTFLRVRRVAGTPEQMHFELATGSAVWARIEQTTTTAFPANGANAKSVFAGGGGGRVFVLRIDDDGSGDVSFSGASFIIPQDRIAQGFSASNNPRDGWATYGFSDWLNWRDSARWAPHWGKLCWAGDRVYMLSFPMDRQASSTPGIADLEGYQLWQWGGPSTQPFRSSRNTHTDGRDLLFISWLSCLGVPAGTGASPSTAWGQNSGGTGFTVTPTVPDLQIECDGSSRYAFAYSNPIGSVTEHVADQGVVHWTTGALVGGRGVENNRPAIAAYDLQNPRWGVKMWSGSKHAGLTANVAVHLFADGGFAMYDFQATTTLHVSPPGTLAGITTGTRYDFRLALADMDSVGRGGPPNLYAELSWNAEGSLNPWNNSGVHTLFPNVSPTASENFSFGVQSAGLTFHDIVWSSAVIAKGPSNGGTMAQLPFANPVNMRGFDCLPHMQLATQGINVRWGGAGGFGGDEFRGPVEWEQGAELLLSSSPAVQWQSTSAITQTITMDAEQVGGLGYRWQHSGIGFFGTNNRRFEVEYSDDAAFTTPSRFHLDGFRATVQIENQVGDVHFRIVGDAQKMWRDGELAGWYARNEERSSPRYMEIVHNVGDIIEVRYKGNLLQNGLVAGTTLVLWAPNQTHLYHDYPQGVMVRTTTAGLTSVYPRYMRITIDGDNTQGKPPEEKWLLGRLQAGLTLPITVPMDWSTQDDNEQPNVDLQTVLSGKRTAYRQGEPRLTMQGTSRGDVDRWRVAFRSVIKNIANYSQHPVVLCTDDQQLHMRSMYARFMGGTAFANAGWRYNRDTKRWEQVGDLRLTFEQEV